MFGTKIRRGKRLFCTSLRADLCVIPKTVLLLCLLFCGIPALLLAVLTACRSLYLPSTLPKVFLSWSVFLLLWFFMTLLPGISAASVYASYPSLPARRGKLLFFCGAELWCSLLGMLLILTRAGIYPRFLCAFLQGFIALWTFFPLCFCSAAAAAAQGIFVLWSVISFLEHLCLLFS